MGKKSEEFEVTKTDKKIAEQLREAKIIDYFEEKPRKKKKRKIKEPKKTDFFIAIVINIVFIYIINHVFEWNLNIILKSFALCLPLLNFSLGTTIFGNFLLLFSNNLRFRSLVYTVTNFFSAIAIFRVYKVFPFIFTEAFPFDINLFIRAILLLAVIGAGVAMILEFLNWLLAPKDKN